MRKIPLGLFCGGILGLLDGLSALFIPSAEGMMTQIVIGSTVKGIIGGLIAGIIARKTSANATIIWSTVAGTLLSVLSAIPSGAYAEIVIPGIFVGLLTGFFTSKGQD